MRLLTVVLLAAISTLAAAQIEPRSLKVDPQHVSSWNTFADNLLRLHTARIAGRRLRKQEIIGGYYKLPDFYREEQFFDADSGRLLSRVVWEREHPDRLHEIEVFIYDDQGRVVRDYLARYLPRGRNAPVQTLINLHAYHGDLHSFRQFDASNNRIYESCRGRIGDEEIFLDIEEDQLMGMTPESLAILESLDYNVCFESLPLSANEYLVPH